MALGANPEYDQEKDRVRAVFCIYKWNMRVLNYMKSHYPPTGKSAKILYQHCDQLVARPLTRYQVKIRV